MSQFICQTPAGYFYDYTESKVLWLSIAAIATTLLTVFTAVFAAPYGANIGLMIFVKFLQGAVTSFIPPGLNSITQGIVGSNGMTSQVSINEMMNHLGTAIIVLTGSILGYYIYPNLGWLFIVSPVACVGVIFFLSRINPKDIDHDEARGLIASDESVATTSCPVDDATTPSFNFGWNSIAGGGVSPSGSRAETPWKVLRDPVLLTFIAIVFLFHTANGTILPLVMQTLAIGSGRSGILLSGLCIIVAQVFMVMSAKICGDYSGVYGRKVLFLIGLFIVPVRCFILTMLLHFRTDQSGAFMEFLILATQIFDGIGAGTFGTMYILVTSDISGGTGRFSMTLGMTTAAMSIGGTVSGYLGEALAQDIGYKQAFFILMFMSLVPALLYLLFMPETLPSINKVDGKVLHRMEPVREDVEEHFERVENTHYKELV
jgi:MFS family permease